MIIVLVAVFLSIFIGIKFRKSNNIDSYLDKNQTTSILGIFAVVIFFSHFFGYFDRSTLNKLDYIAAFTTSALGQLMVVPFLFFSGYGIFEQFKAKGDSYASKLPKNRILKVYLMFLLSLTLYIVLSFVLKTYFSPTHYLWSLVGFTSIGNSNWYVVVILVLYFSTYLSIKIGGNQKMSLIINVLLCVALVLMLRKFDLDSAWWNTIPAYAFGLIYSYIKPSILKFYKKHKANRFILFGISIALTVNFGILNSIFASDNFYTLMVISFAFIFVSFLALFTVGNKIVLTLGKYCFWIYILQRFPMRICCNLPVVKDNTYLFFGICIVITAALAFGMNKLFEWLWPKLNKKKA